MRAAVVGGGPAGLYWALLMKKADPGHDITVLERDPAGATYGWGVVFSDRTLTAFREADYRTYVDITERFVSWDAIDIWYRDEVVRSGGHVFAGLARKALLGVLAARCEELGVDIRFRAEVARAEELGDFDLVVAADGVHSGVRTALAGNLGASLSYGKSRYIWFGTDRPLDAFTFIFRNNDHGLFQVHAYPFDDATSTFIVECGEDVWRRAGLDKAEEHDSITYCEKLFAEELRGHTLKSNNSKWMRFVTVRTRTWRHRNTVLLGDAAHTAHFTIGSGTKLAMEDAIALARAFEEHDEMEAALAHYELERKPIIEHFQEAAAESQSYFENVKRYLHFEPMQFAFHLLTRSGRIDYATLRQRDPHFVDHLDRWFGAARPGGRRALIAPGPMFTPLELRAVRLANRAALRPPPTYSCGEGLLSDSCSAVLMDAARRGAAIVVTEPVAASPEGRMTPGDPGLYSHDHVRGWRGVVEHIHAETEAIVCLRLSHAGRRGATQPPTHALDVPLGDDGWPLLAPSPLPYTQRSPIPEEMDRADMDAVVAAFLQAARRAAEAGIDLIEVDMAHGYLLGSFISPVTNRRSDDYGGSIGDRLRFPLEVFEAVRGAWPQDRPLAAAINGSDWTRGGAGIREALSVAGALKDLGCDLVEVMAGHTTPQTRPVYGRYFLARYSDVVRNEAHIPTMTSGNITTSVEINTLVAGGRADVCVFSPRIVDWTAAEPPAD